MNWIDFTMRILLSILLGFLIGLERQITGHTAGIRINILISMGSCLFLMFPIISGSDEVFRIASYIVSGVEFLCSGDVIGDKVEVIAEYCSVGSSKNHVLEGIVRQALKLPDVVSAGWEVL